LEAQVLVRIGRAGKLIFTDLKFIDLSVVTTRIGSSLAVDLIDLDFENVRVFI